MVSMDWLVDLPKLFIILMSIYQFNYLLSYQFDLHPAL
jgi:hypothetical protein